MILGMLGIAAIYISIYLLPSIPYFQALIFKTLNRKD